MSDVEYTVAAILNLTNEAEAQSALGRVAARADATSSKLKGLGLAASQGLARVGAVVGDTLDHLARLGAGALAAGGAIGGAFAFNEVKTGLVGVNAQLEDSRLAIASTMNLLGGAESFTGGLDLASELIANIRADSAALPGEFGDFVAIAQTLTPDLLNAGKSIAEIRDLTRQTAVAAASVGVGFDQGGREMAQLLEGRAGAHNTFGMRLGINVHTKVAGKDFNEATAGERLGFLSTALAKTNESLPGFERSWKGITSTLGDYRKQVIGIATAPLFDKMKRSMLDVGQYYTDHRGLIHQLANDVGQKLGGAWDHIDAIGRKLPGKAAELHYLWFGIRGEVYETAHAMEHAIGGAFHKLQPLARFFAKELETPGKLLKELVALRLGAAAAGALPGVARVAMSGLGGAAGGAGAGLGGVAAGAAAAGPALAVVGAALVGIAAVGTAVYDDAYGSAKMAAVVAHEANDTIGILGETFADLAKRGGILRNTLDLTGAVLLQVGGDSLGGLNVALGGARDAINWVNNDLLTFVKVGFGFSDEARIKIDVMKVAIDGMANAIAAAIPPINALTFLYRAFKSDPDDDDFGVGAGAALDRSTQATSWLGNTTKMPAVPTGMTNQNTKYATAPVVDARGSKFEIKIDARDQDPDRIIRRMITKIGETAVQGTMGSAAAGVPSGGA
ncbi:MAG: hypothetical protein HYV09_18095 [Deltaproteobacteria bacterium]|nr:hypothetical protein [Deltaproteobacteria bacterium]